MWASVVLLCMDLEKVLAALSGTSVPIVQQYTYLGLSMTIDLDLNDIVQDRKEKATNS